MKTALFAFLCAMTMALPTLAQERTASGASNVQVTWSALSNLITANTIKTEAIGTRVDQITFCGKQGKTYAPSQPDADAQGCRDANQINQINTNLTNIYTCNKAGQVFDGTKCIESLSKPPIVLTGASTCPGGYTLIGCSGTGGSFGSIYGSQCRGHTYKYTSGRGYYGSSSNEHYEDSYISLVNGSAIATCMKN